MAMDEVLMMLTIEVDDDVAAFYEVVANDSDEQVYEWLLALGLPCTPVN